MINVRTSGIGDEYQLFELVACFPVKSKISIENFSLLFREKISDDSAIIKVAVQNSKLIGYASANSHSAFYASGNVVWVDEVFVSHEHRSLNVGRQLMGSIEEWAVGRNSSIVSLAIAGARDFYSKLVRLCQENRLYRHVSKRSKRPCQH